MTTATKRTKRFDVQYRRANWPEGRWQSLGHPTTDRARAESIARGSAIVEPEFEFRVTPAGGAS